MKAVGLFFLIHLIAITVVRAQDLSTYKITLGSSNASQVAKSSADDCTILLPQLESDYRGLEQKSKFLFENSKNQQEGYWGNFNQATQALFDVAAAREAETQQIVQSRNDLKQSLQDFSVDRSVESSKNLQTKYLELSSKLTTALQESQKILAALQAQLSQVESTRDQYELNRQQMESLDHQKLALEAQLISLKIRCQPAKRY